MRLVCIVTVYMYCMYMFTVIVEHLPPHLPLFLNKPMVSTSVYFEYTGGGAEQTQ